MPDIEMNDLELPSNLIAEQVILGSIIVEPDLIRSAAERISPEHFSVKLHSGIFSVMMQLFIASEDINIVTIMEGCNRHKVFGSAEEAKEYLVKLSEKSIESASLDSYMRILDEKFKLRQLILAARDIYGKAFDASEDPGAVLDYAEKRIFDIRNENEVTGLEHIRNTVRSIFNELSYLAAHPEEANKKGLSSGFPSLDKVIYGLNKSDFILIAARPGMGKTSFAMNIAVNAARISPGTSVAVFNLEMNREQIVSRMLASEGRIPSEQIKTGQIEASKWRGLAEAAEMLHEIELYVDDNSSISIGEMKAKLRRVKNLGLVVIDYLQLMSTGRRDGNRVSEVSEITRNLKIMAKELNVPVIALSQLSRSPEARLDKRPQLSDLRDSGSIEQDADIVMFLYRDAYYTKSEEDISSCECIIAKNRHGDVGTINLRWDGQFTRFSDLEQRYGN